MNNVSRRMMAKRPVIFLRFCKERDATQLNFACSTDINYLIPADMFEIVVRGRRGLYHNATSGSPGHSLRQTHGTFIALHSHPHQMSIKMRI